MMKRNQKQANTWSHNWCPRPIYQQPSCSCTPDVSPYSLLELASFCDPTLPYNPHPTFYLCMNRVSVSAPSTPSLSASLFLPCCALFCEWSPVCCDVFIWYHHLVFCIWIPWYCQISDISQWMMRWWCSSTCCRWYHSRWVHLEEVCDREDTVSHIDTWLVVYGCWSWILLDFFVVFVFFFFVYCWWCCWIEGLMKTGCRFW